MANILIFGGDGWIGSKVVSILEKENINYIKSNNRADDIDSVNIELDKNPSITHVMSFIGRTHGIYEDNKINTIDYLEKPGKLVENIKDNLFAPVSLALLCKDRNIHFTYLGTGCIFDFDNDHPNGNEETGFLENDTPNFFGSSYSIVKGFTDKMMHLLESTVLNIRIRMPITDEVNARNFITKITSYSKICSMPNSMTVLNELLPFMVNMALNHKTGTINLTNPGLITHNEILNMYKELVDNDFVWENFDINDQDKILLSKRSNNCLNTEKIENLYPNILNIKDSIRNMLISMKQKM